MGEDVDDLLAYQTPKVVKIKDRTLGMLKYILMLVIFCYVFVWQVLYKGSHFQMDQLSGVARMQLQHPTLRCNPMDVTCASNYTSLMKLPYCTQYTGKKPSAVQRPCKFYDALDLLKPLDGGYLIPSFIETYNQLESCKPNAKNDYKCKKKYEYADKDGKAQNGPGRARPKGKFFVADIEAFTLLIDHSFRVETGSVEYDDRFMQGYWLDCSQSHFDMDSTLSKIGLSSERECEKKPILCVHKDCKKLGMVTAGKKSLITKDVALDGENRGGGKARRQSRSGVGSLSAGSQPGGERRLLQPAEDLKHAAAGRDVKEVFSLEAGDVFPVSTLYTMAGRSLDESWYDQDDKGNKSARQRGTVLVVNIHYNNMAPWTLFRPKTPPEYVISVTSRPVEKYKSMSASDVGNTRELTVSYGTLVIVQSTGTIGVFRMIHMLIVISTSLGLLAASSVVTDILALYVLPMKDEYNKAKFEDTGDLHDLFLKREADGALT